jgi:CheY-like chemotaxis protein
MFSPLVRDVVRAQAVAPGETTPIPRSQPLAISVKVAEFTARLEEKREQDRGFMPLHAVRVLLVEDEEANWLAMSRCLRSCGFKIDKQVKHVTSANEAVQVASQTIFHFIFMDNNLVGPELGVDAAKKITKEKEQAGEPVPVMFFTSSNPCNDAYKYLFKAEIEKSPLFDDFHELLLSHWPKIS